MLTKKINFQTLNFLSKASGPGAGYRKLTAKEIEAVYLNKKVERYVVRMILDKGFDDSQAENAILLIGEALNILHVPVEAEMADICKILINFLQRELGYIMDRMSENNESAENRVSFQDKSAEYKRTVRALESANPEKKKMLLAKYRQNLAMDLLAESQSSAWGTVIELQGENEEETHTYETMYAKAA